MPIKPAGAPDITRSGITTLPVVATRVGLLELAEKPGEHVLTLSFTLEDHPGRDYIFEFPLEAGEDLAARIQGALEAHLRLLMVESGATARETAAVDRELARKRRIAANRARDQIMGAARSPEAKCHKCPRAGVIRVEGVNYCKRHAEEAGVRPKGKVI